MSHVGAVVVRLRGVNLFVGFEADVLELVAATVRLRKFDAGETVFLRGDQADSMFVVEAGQIRLSMTTAEGREVTVRHVATGEAFGEIAMLDGGIRTATATATRTTALLAVPAGPFRAIVLQRPAIAMAVIRFLCSRLRDTTDQLEAIALMPLEQRLARLLIQLAASVRGTSGRVRLPLDLSQGDLAALIAASRPKVNQILVAWDAEGTAKRTPEGLMIDIEALERVAEGRDA
jgi:CRP-like cAMP-binding protein